MANRQVNSNQTLAAQEVAGQEVPECRGQEIPRFGDKKQKRDVTYP
jgi:hypothetical protein